MVTVTDGDFGKVRALRTKRAAARLLAVAACGFSLAGLVACSSVASGGAAGGAGSSCGNTRTGVNVPVVIMVTKGSVDCAAVMRVEHDYAAMIKQNDVHGNGGGAPVNVDGWTCQGYPTPQVLKTGDASECHTASAEVVAELALSSTGS